MSRRRRLRATTTKAEPAAVQSRRDRAITFAILAGLMVAAAAADILLQGLRPLWLDEASSFWTTRETVAGLLKGFGEDGTPPFYFLLLKSVLHVFGSSELALRLLSVVSAVLLVPVLFAVTRRVADWRTGLIAAGLGAISPLVHYYAIEARPYALLQLETGLLLYTFIRALADDVKWRWWMLLTACQALQLWTHVYAVFLLPVPLIASIVVVDRERRWPLATRAAMAAGVAVLLNVPWLRLAMINAGYGVGDWIVAAWTAIPPIAAIPRSLETFGFGGEYPAYLSYLGTSPAFRFWSAAATVIVLVMAIARWRNSQRHRPARGSVVSLLIFLFAPLAFAWAYSWLRTPLYLPGRYDSVVLPVFLVLFALGLSAAFRWRRWAGLGLGCAILALAATSWSSSLGELITPDQLDVTAGTLLGRSAGSNDRVISTLLRQNVTRYYAYRSGFAGPFSSFPLETNAHPGWYSRTRLLADTTHLKAEGSQLLADMVADARAGRTIWLLTSPPSPIDDFLLEPLADVLDVDDGRSHPEVGLLCLKLR